MHLPTIPQYLCWTPTLWNSLFQFSILTTSDPVYLQARLIPQSNLPCNVEFLYILWLWASWDIATINLMIGNFHDNLCFGILNMMRVLETLVSGVSLHIV